MDNNKRPETMARITTSELAEAFIEEQVSAIQKQVGDKKVLLALSGGVDSSVVAALLIRAIGKQLVCVHVKPWPSPARESRSRWWRCSATRWKRTWCMWMPSTAF